MEKIIYLNKSKRKYLPTIKALKDNLAILRSQKYRLSILIQFTPKNKEEKPDYSSLEALLQEIDKEIENSPSNKESLESIIEEEKLKDNKIIYPNFKKYPPVYLPLGNSPHINPKSKAQVFYVPPSYMPKVQNGKVLGLYDPMTHSIYISNDLTPTEEAFVYLHEEAHSRGIYDENEADNYAALRTGFNLRHAA